VALLCALLFAACGVFAEQPSVAPPTPLIQPNVLANPGFEDGADPWYAGAPDWQPFTVNNARPRSGALSLELDLRGDEQAPGAAIAGATQRLQGDAFAEFISGYYYVDDWQPAQGFQYLDVVITINGGNHPDGAAVHELHLLLAGAPEEPASLTSGQSVFLSRDEPAVGEWVYFSYPVLEAIRTHLGWDPIGWESIDVALTVRYDQKTPGAAAAATVYYDDLYFGPQVFNPNRLDVD
jgi:hypothetical protein